MHDIRESLRRFRAGAEHQQQTEILPRLTSERLFHDNLNKDQKVLSAYLPSAHSPYRTSYTSTCASTYILWGRLFTQSELSEFHSDQSGGAPGGTSPGESKAVCFST